MLALRSAPPVFGLAEAERVARDLYGLAADAVALSGERDCNFQLRTADGRHFVLKIVDGSADPLTIDCQIQVLRHLAQQDPTLPVPRLIPTLQGSDLGAVRQQDCGFATCLLSFLPGRVLSESPATRQVLMQVGRTLARLGVALQGFFHPALAQRIAWDVRRLPELLQHAPLIQSQEQRRTVATVAGAIGDRLFQLQGLRSQAIHGDCHGGNLLTDGAGDTVCGILDFGDMIHGPLILEPAVAMAELLTEGSNNPRELAAMLEGYSLGHIFSASDIAVLFDLITARHAVTLLVHAWRKRHDAPGAALLDDAARHAVASLGLLQAEGRERLTREWQAAARVMASVSTVVSDEEESVDLRRRQTLLGAGAELFYDQPLHFVRGAGVWLYDRQGQPHLDVYNNVPHVGHCHPRVVAAIQRQVGRLATHTRYLHGAILRYAEQLTARCEARLDACIFVNSGSEANDVAWRLAKFATGNRGALVIANAYHGITDAVAALTPGAGSPTDPHVAALAAPCALGTVDDPLSADALAAVTGDLSDALEMLRARGFSPAALFIDSALTSSGIYDPPVAWLAAIAAGVRAAGGLIVGDEVQYGLGRSGSHFWGFERRGLSPDIVTLGKPLGNGFPLGVVIANRALIEAFQAKAGLFSTFGGNAVAAEAGLAVLEVIDREALVANAASTGQYLRARLLELTARHPCLGPVRGTGLLQGLEIQGPDATAKRLHTRQIVNAMASQSRVLIGSEGPLANVLKLRPPLSFRPEHVDLLIAAIDAAASSRQAPGR